MEDASLLNFDVAPQRQQWIPCSAHWRILKFPRDTGLFLYRLLSEKSSGKPRAIDKRKSTLKQMSQSPSAMGIVTWFKNIQEWLEFLILPLMVSKDLWGEQSLNNERCHFFPQTGRTLPVCNRTFLYFWNVWMTKIPLVTMYLYMLSDLANQTQLTEYMEIWSEYNFQRTLRAKYWWPADSEWHK